MMHPDFWHERWQNQQIGFHRDEVHPYLCQFWPGLGLDPAGSIFVPLCGKSRDLIWLRAHGHAVVGVEVSPVAVEAFFEDNGLVPVVSSQAGFTVYECAGIRIFCGDFFLLTPQDLSGVIGWYDRAALIALPPELRERYVAHLQKIMPANGRGLLVAFEYPQTQMEGPPFSVPAAEVNALFSNGPSVQLIKAFDILDQEPRFQAKGITRLQEVVYQIDL